MRVEVGLQVVQLVGVGLLAEDGRAVVVARTTVWIVVGVVQEVEHEGIVLLGVRAVQARERLHGLDAGERLVHIHRVQQRLVVAGLELVGADQEAVRVFLDRSAISLLGKPLSDASVTFAPAVLVLAGEGDDRLIRALALDQVRLEGVEVLDGALDAAGDHHRPRLAADLLLGEHLLVEVVDHDLGLQPDGVVVALHVAPELLLRLLRVELRIVLDRLHQLVVARHRRVVLRARRG